MKPALSGGRLAFGSARLHQTCFFSQLRINLRKVFPEPFVALPAQQGVLPVVLLASLQSAFLLGSQFFFHL
jgi:hypothetical protein